MNRRRRPFQLLVLLSQLTYSQIAWPYLPSNVTAGEIALLPPYCPHTEAFGYGPKNSPNQSPEAPKWEARLGPTFWTLHHYCRGLVVWSRYKAGKLTSSDKGFFPRVVVDEYMFVIRNSTSDFILLPEIWTRVGEAALAADDVGVAMDAYAKARQIKPDYWPAYTQWADFLLRYGRKAEAKVLIEEGLLRAPGTRQLIDAYRNLGGNPDHLPAVPPTAPGSSLPVPSSVGASAVP